MSAATPFRRVFLRCPIKAPSTLRRNFRTSCSNLSPSNDPSVPNERPDETRVSSEGPDDSSVPNEGLDNPNVPAERPRRRAVTAKSFKPYSKSQKKALKASYTPAQLAALEAGEAAIDTEDLAQQAALRVDPFAFEYVDDFASIHPVIDKPIRAPKGNHDRKQRYKTEDEIAEDFANFVQNMPEKPSRLDYMKFKDNLRLTVGKEEAERNPRSYMSPEIPKGLDALRQPGMNLEEEEIDPAMKRLMRQTGFSLETIRKLRVKNLVVHRVVNQTRMGKIQSMYYLTVAGNGKGLLGIGEGKSTEPEDARRQARFNAIRKMQPVPRYEDRTIYGDVKVKVGAVEIELMTRPPGFGVRCQEKIFEMCRCCGIYDLAARVTRSRNPMNTIKATFQALMSQRLPEEVARGLGKKLVDVRKVYYDGNV